MRTVQLPETHAPRLHIECVTEDGGSYCIETRSCNSIQIPDNVVDIVVTPLGVDDGQCIRIRQQVDFMVVR